MRVVWINELASFIGGCESYIYNTAINLKAWGVTSILLYNPLHQVDRRFLNAFAEAFPLMDLPLQLTEIPHDLIYLHQLSDPLQLRLLAEDEAPVIKFFHDHQLFCLRGSKLPYFSNKPCTLPAGCRCYPLGIVLCRKKNFIGLGIKTFGQLKKLQQLHRQFDGYVVASQFMHLEAYQSGFAEDKIRTIEPYSFHAENKDVKSSRNQYEILFVGQLIRSKGLDSLLQALALLPEKYQLNIAGSGCQERDYRKLSSFLGLEKRISFLGSLPQSELSHFYRSCSCTVIPSRWPEPFGLVGIEAMQFGSPVIACEIGGIPEWLEEGKNGYLVPPNSPQELMRAILKICENPILAASMQNYSMMAANEKFNMKNHCMQLHELFMHKIDKKTHAWGRFTAYGSDNLEQDITSMTHEIKLLLRKTFSPEEYRVIVVVGSYGKGEGGVEMRKGKECPHNNFDLLMVNKVGKDPVQQKIALDRVLLPLSEKYGIGFDTSVISEHKMKYSPPTLLSYELYHGHKFLLGDGSFISRLALGDFKKVPVDEFQALIVNRGTLMIINDLILQSSLPLSDQKKKVVIKHLMKAIIGAGDASLYFLNDHVRNEYHWSYRERQKRVETLSLLSPSLRKLYATASDFRLRPDYQPYLTQDLSMLTELVRHRLANAYLECERHRLGRQNLQADNYVEFALEALWLNTSISLWQWLKSWQGLLHPTSRPLGQSLTAKFAFLCLSPRQRLTALYPIVAFGWGNQKLRTQAARYLKAHSSNPHELAKAYLNQWSRYGDINFDRSQSEWDVSDSIG